MILNNTCPPGVICINNTNAIGIIVIFLIIIYVINKENYKRLYDKINFLQKKQINQEELIEKKVNIMNSVKENESYNMEVIENPLMPPLKRNYHLEHEIDKMYITEMDIGEWDYYKGEIVPLDFPMMMNEEIIAEAKYKGKEVKLGIKGVRRVKGKKGRAEAYTRDPRTGKIKRVEFGSEMSKAMGSSEEHKKRRKSFGDRHKCSAKKDKTKAGWWSCRLTKMFGRNIPGWW